MMSLKNLLLILALAWFVGIQKSPAQKIKTIDFSQLEPKLKLKNDTTYVINFWAMWCKPCIEELPVFEQIKNKYANKKVKVILINMDFGAKVEERLTAFLERKEINAQTIILDDPDANTWINKVDSSWNGSIPATVVYQNNNRKFFNRKITLAELAKTINQLKN